MLSHSFQDVAAGTKVLLKNNRRSDRKGGKETSPRSSAVYTVANITSKKCYKLIGPSGKILSKTYNGSQIKVYKE